ncbi:MAG: peptidoglycan editing factor PgeF [Actinomycetota bacterium]
MLVWSGSGNGALRVGTAGSLPLLTVPALATSGIRVGFSGRLGGVSEGHLAGANLSFAVEDDPESVEENRRRLARALGFDSGSLVLGRQVHGARVVEVGEVDRGAGSRDRHSAIPDTDALVTGVAGLPLGVLVADCLPLLLADPVAGRVAAVHVGWRGLGAGVVEAAVERLTAGADPASVVAVLGPRIGPCCFEVGEQVMWEITDRYPLARSTSGAGRDAVDLGAGAIQALERLGVSHAVVSGECTRCESGRFFSYRADPLTGRQIGVVLLER